MSSGLFALLDDVAGLAKVAAASLDDAAAQSARASAKAAGVVIDDAAMTPGFVTGFPADRELPIVGRIALGSLRNKLLYLLPAALVLSLVAPWAITPLLMLGGLYLCFEGAEKVLHALRPHRDAHADAAPAPADPKAFEDAKVRSAIQTDLILSAEIMAITLGTVGTAAMVWVGGGILLHGMEVLGWPAPAHAAHRLAAAAGDALPVGQAGAEWLVGAAVSGVLGLLVGAAVLPVAGLARRR